MGEVGGLPCPFLKIEKKCSDLGKNTLTVRIYRLSFSFNLSFSILRVSRSQNSKNFPCEATFLCVVRQIFIEMFFVSYSHQHCFSFMFNTSQRKTCCPKKQTRKVLITDFLFLFSFKMWNVVFNFSVFGHWQTFSKSMCSTKGISGTEHFLNCSKNPWWMKFNFLIKNITSNFTRYGAPIARSSHRRRSVKKVFLKILRISLENPGVGVSF